MLQSSPCTGHAKLALLDGIVALSVCYAVRFIMKHGVNLDLYVLCRQSAFAQLRPRLVEPTLQLSQSQHPLYLRLQRLRRKQNLQRSRPLLRLVSLPPATDTASLHIHLTQSIQGCLFPISYCCQDQRHKASKSLILTPYIQQMQCMGNCLT